VDTLARGLLQRRATMTTRPHDALFKSAFESPADATALLRELLPPAVCEAVAWETLGREAGSYVDPSLADRHSDLLFRSRLRAGEPGLIYLLLEHQSTDDPALLQRVLSYQTRIWDRYRKERSKPRRSERLPPVIAVLVSHVPGGWTAARSFEELFDPALMALPGMAGLTPRFSPISLDLTLLSDDDLKARTLAPFQKLALWLLRDGRDPACLLGNFESWRPLLIQAGRSRSGRDIIRALIEYMFRVIDPLYRDELRAKIRMLGRDSEEIAMTIAEQLHEEGRARGRQEGRIATLRSLLLFKFQTLDAAAEARLQAATPEAIDRYLQRVLVADSLAAVFAE
jgi:hypothetical protein